MPRLRSPRPRRAAGALLLVIALAGCSGDDTPVVQVEEVGEGEVVATVSAPAQVAPAARQDVAASVSGVVVALNVADGGSVSSGQEVVRLESSQVEAAQEQAEASLVAAQGMGGLAVSGGGDQTVAAAEDIVHDLDERSLPNIEDARAQAAQIADPQQRASADAAVAAIEASYLNTRAALLAVAQTLAQSQEAIGQSLTAALNQALSQATAGQRAQAEAAAAAASQQAEGLSVVAPFAGVVSLGDAAATDGGATAAFPDAAAAAAAGGGDVDPSALAGALPALAGGEGGGTLRVGAPVSAGQTLFTVYDLSTRYVDADVDEVDAPGVRAGLPATVLVDAFPDVTFRGEVESVAVEAGTTEAGGVGYATRVRITGADSTSSERSAREAVDQLLLGQTASAEIEIETTDADLVVPSRALLDRDAEQVVLVVRDGVVVQVPVRTLTLGEDTAAVEGDLEVGDQVVVAGYEELQDGDEVVVE